MARTKTDDKSALLEDLARSGLDKHDARDMGLSIVAPDEVKRLTGKFSVPAYKIPYYTVDGEEQEFYRLRFLSNRGPFGSKITRRYAQPSGTLPAVYFPPQMRWEAVVDDVEQQIYITEGEKKAAKACREGIPTIGLGGVWSWKSRKAGLPHLPEFDLFAWEGREVIIVYDSDMSSKPQIAGAMHALAKELLKFGAVPCYISLPDVDEEGKTGLDDFLLAEGADVFLDLPVTDFEVVKELWEFNEEFAILEDPISILRLNKREPINLQQFTSILVADRRMWVTDSKGDEREVSVASEWLKWPHRQKYAGLVYEPGEPMSTSENCLNTWKGWRVEPKEGDVSLWRELLDFIFEPDPTGRRWFEQWAAYPIQNPGSKLYSAVLFHSTQTGVGKSLIGETIGHVYGDNFRSIARKDITGEFNEWAIGTQFVLADEISSMDKRKDVDLLKTLITRERITINKKFQPTYVLKDCINYYLTSQHIDGVYVEEKDRRFFIHEVPNYRLPQDFYDEYDTWFHSEEGIAALFYYMLHEVDCSDFNPKAEPPMTVSKRNMIELSASNIDLWCRELRDIPANILRAGNKPSRCDLWTIHDLLVFYDSDGSTKVAPVGLSIALRRAGFDKLPDDVCLSDGRTVQLWAVRNAEKWKRAKPRQLVKHYESRGEK